jgi:enterochelin esterase-like enzyme
MHSRAPLRCLAGLAASLVLALAALPAHGADPAPCQSTATGDLRLLTLESHIFGNNRTLRVLLPPDYDAPANRARRYPVLYLLDGQALFDACLSVYSHHEWRVDETVYQLIAAHAIPPMIVVGIDNAGEQRAHEFLPYKDFVGDPDMPPPAGMQFPDFLGSEVLPLIDASFRTLTGAANTGIGGSSYGGVAALYALQARPGTFGYGLIESAPLWVGMGQLVRDTKPLTATPLRVYVGWGAKEIEDNPRRTAMWRRLLLELQANFRAAGYDNNSYRFVIDQEGRHTEESWARRLPAALTFLFGDWREQAAGSPTTR